MRCRKNRTLHYANNMLTTCVEGGKAVEVKGKIFAVVQAGSGHSGGIQSQERFEFVKSEGHFRNSFRHDPSLLLLPAAI